MLRRESNLTFDFLKGRRVPEANPAVFPTAGGENSAVGRERNRSEWSDWSKSSNLLIACQTPQPHGSVLRSAGKCPAVWRERHPHHRSVMPSQGVQQFAGRTLPKLDRLVVTCGCDQCTIG